MAESEGSPQYGWAGLVVGALALNGISLFLSPNESAKAEYAKSTRPRFAPPAWAFGVVWPINNLLTLWGNHEVLNSPPSADRTAYLKLQAAAWILFTTYGLARFRLRSPTLGFIDTVLYAAVTGASAVRAARIDRRLLLSFATLLPWLALATALSIYQLGDEDPLFDA